MVGDRSHVVVYVVEPDPELRATFAGILEGRVFLHESADHLRSSFAPVPGIIILGPGASEDWLDVVDVLPENGASHRVLILSHDDPHGFGLAIEHELVVSIPMSEVHARLEEHVDRLASEIRTPIGAVISLDAARATRRRRVSKARHDHGEPESAAEPAVIPVDFGFASEPCPLITVFSTKGGAGTSMVATNLAAALTSLGQPGPVVLIDADLEAGDLAVMLGLTPAFTIFDAVEASESGEPHDPDLLRSMLTRHISSRVELLAAPFEPAFGSRIGTADLTQLVEEFRSFASMVIVDTPVRFDDRLLALLSQTDEAVVVTSLDRPSAKNLTVAMQTIELLESPPARIHVVVNRSDAAVGLAVSDIESVIGRRVETRLPSHIAVPRSVNAGVPLVVSEPGHPVSLAMSSLARRISSLETIDAS